ENFQSTELIIVENQANGGVLISQARVEPDRPPQRQIGHGILLNPRGSFVGGTTLEATFSIDESLLRGCKEFLFFAMPTPLDVPFVAIPPPHVREVCELGQMCARFPCSPGKALAKQKRSASFGGGGFGGPVGMMDFIGTGGPQDPTMPMTLMNDIGSMNPSVLNGYGNKFGPNGYGSYGYNMLDTGGQNGRFGPGSYGSGYGGNGYYGGGYGSTYGAGGGLNPYGSGGGFYPGASLPYSMYWPQSQTLQYPMMGGGTPLQYSSQNPYSTAYWGGFMNNVFPLQHLPVFTAPPALPTPATVLQAPFTVTVPTVTQQISSDLSTSLLPSKMLNKSTVRQRNETKHLDTVSSQLTEQKPLNTVSLTRPTGTVTRPLATVASIVMGRRLRRQTLRERRHTAMFADFAHEHGSTMQGTAYEGQDRQFHRAEPAVSVLNPQYEALARYQAQHGQAQMFDTAPGPWRPIDQGGGGSGGLNRTSMYWPYRTAVGAADVQGAPQGIRMAPPAMTNIGNGEAMSSPPAGPFGIGPAMEPPSELQFYSFEKCDFGTDPDWCGDYVKQFVNWFEQYGSRGKTICSSAMESLRNSDHRCCNALKKLNC
uniref:ZP domain-containing protein n=1 Tax=Globodera pallida TaxID=36090 RepID=A0A183C329_GLOPA